MILKDYLRRETECKYQKKETTKDIFTYSKSFRLPNTSPLLAGIQVGRLGVKIRSD